MKSKYHWKKYAAEALGTALLTFAVLVSIRFSLPLSTPVVAGLTLGLMVYAIGGISGSHINPSVTIGLLSTGDIDAEEAAYYVISQCIGAVAAMILFNAAFGLPAVRVAGTLPIFFAEAAGAGVLSFGVHAVVRQKVQAAASGIAIGGSLLLGILIASGASNGVLNPAVAVGIGSVSWAYLLGPLVGAVIAAHLYKWMVK